MISLRRFGVTEGWFISFNTNGRLCFSGNIGGSFSNPQIVGTTSVVAANTWSHVAVTRASGTFRLFLNGILQATSSISGAVNHVSVASLCIGDSSFDTPQLSFAGSIGDVRIYRGIAKYTAGFTAPTTFSAPNLTADSNYLSCVFVAPLTSTWGTSDRTGKKLTNAGVTLSTTEKRFGSASVQNSSSATYFDLPQSNDVAYGTGDFTVECWVYSGWGNLLSHVTDGQWISGNNSQAIAVWNTGQALWLDFNGSYGTTSTLMPANAWNHFAVSRTAGVLRTFVNGNVTSTTSSHTYSYDARSIRFMSRQDLFNGRHLVGYLDSFRIVKGHSVYRGAFTVPSSPFVAGS